MPVRICFVCLGNICRSPTAEGVFRHLLAKRGLTGAFTVQSAGTAAHHVGESPDPRSTKAAAARGITLEGAAQRFDAEDFERFDYVIAMDRSNRDDLRARAPTPRAADKVALLRAWDPDNDTNADLDVPDPYYGGPSGFDDVLDLCQRSCAELLDELQPTRA
ncbi:MAG: low molecular weight protein-tyrosine-phosphatase [Myxococcota bacterium]